MTKSPISYMLAAAAGLFLACGGAAGEKPPAGNTAPRPPEESQPPETDQSPEPPALDTSPEAVQAGAEVFGNYCSFCHGENGQGAGDNPMLIGDGALKRFADYQAVLAFVSKQMPNDDPGALSEKEYRSVVAFLRDRNIKAGNAKE